MAESKFKVQKFEVKKSVRFELIRRIEVKEKENRINLEDIFDKDFLLEIIKLFHEKIDDNLINNTKNIFSAKDEDDSIFRNLIKESIETIKKEYLKIIYNKAIKYKNIKEARNDFSSLINTQKEYFKDFEDNNKYFLPGNDFSYNKKSDVFYSIKFLAKIIKDGDIKCNLLEKYKNTIESINSINPNSSNFFKVNTLNPLTKNRWKKEKIFEDLKLVQAELDENTKLASEKVKEIIEKILKEYNGNLKFEKNEFGTIFKEKIEKLKEKEKLSMFDIEVFVNIFDSFISYIKKENKELKDDSFYKKDKKDKKYKKGKELIIWNTKIDGNQIGRRELGYIDSLKSKILGYKVQLIDNFEVKNYSFLVKHKGFYFLVEKEFEDFTSFSKYFKDSGEAEAFYIDSMTFGGFEKLFLSKTSDVKFVDNSLAKNYSTFKDVEKITNELFIYKLDFRYKIKDLYNKKSFKKENSKGVKEFKEFLKENNKEENNEEVSDLFINGKFNGKKYGKQKKEFDVKIDNDIELLKNSKKELEKKLKNAIIDFLLEIKDKDYKVGNDEKSLDFLDESTLKNLKNDTETLEDLKMYFNKAGYKKITKKIDFKELLKEDESRSLKLYQLKSKDFNYFEGFKPKTKIKIKDKNGNKDLQTMYFESFFEENSTTKLGADFRISGINKTIEKGEKLENFWEKDKNKKRYDGREGVKELINNFDTRFTRDREYATFFLTLNGDNYIKGEDLKEKLKNFNENFNGKLFNNKTEINILSLDHGVGSFLTFGMYKGVIKSKKIEKSQDYDEFIDNFDNLVLDNPKINNNSKKQYLFKKDEKENLNDIEYLLNSYTTKYNEILKYLKIERQVQEGIKEFANRLMGETKKIISDNKGENKVKGVNEIKHLLENRLDKIVKGKNKKYDKNNIYMILNNYGFSYNIYSENTFKQNFPDQEDLKEKIDSYTKDLEDLKNYNEKLKEFYNKIEAGFDSRSIANYTKYKDTAIFNYKKYFNIKLSKTTNFKKGYTSAIIGIISKLVLEGKIDLIVLENNILDYGENMGHNVNKKGKFKKENSESGSGSGHMGTENHSMFISYLINKMGFLYNKEDYKNDKKLEKNLQLSYILQQKDYKNLKGEQNGVLVFVTQEDTSKICPNCLEKGKKKDNKPIKGIRIKGSFIENEIIEEIKELKELNIVKSDIDEYIKNEKNHVDIVYCKECKFNTIDHETIKNGDTLATYNIAKLGLDHIIYKCKPKS
ncbi:hypothetical protein BKN14_00910 [Candidatus Gracilibacteria bacterium HOT-871]|nr:hypothetical protein BKN14_00910 [Candidatus Gracilibacteria bacterium HOT-871]